METSAMLVWIRSNVRQFCLFENIAARQNTPVGRSAAVRKPFQRNVIFTCRIAEKRRSARIRHKRAAQNWTLSPAFYPPCHETEMHREKRWNPKVMLTKPCENRHLSTDPLDRLANDVYDCVTDDALGAGDRWGTRELGLLRQRGPAR